MDHSPSEQMSNMKAIDIFMKFIDVNLIYCLPALILTLIFIKLFFRNRFKIEQALNVVRWTIVTYTALSLLCMLYGTISHSDESEFMSRATDEYRFAYWAMFGCSLILPFSLLIGKIGKNAVYLLFISILLKLGRYFEIFVIVITSFHRDYSPGNGSESEDFSPFGLLLIPLQGVLLGVALLTIVEVANRKRATGNF